MTRILLSGCSGRMGKAISRLAGENENISIAAGYDITPLDGSSYPVFIDISSCPDNVDAVVDFSHPAAFDSVTGFCVNNGIPLVMATTGLSGEQLSKLDSISVKIPVFRSSNMSIGVNLLMELAKKSAAFGEGLFDIEIVEKHHRNKIDAPSGTALSIAEAINESLDKPLEPVYDRTKRSEKRRDDEIGIHAVRGGSIVGEHSVIFAGRDEIIELRHEALSRDIFAEGALRAAIFISGMKPGMYSMSDLIHSK